MRVWAQGVQGARAGEARTEHVLERGRHGVLPVQKQALDDLHRLSIALLLSTAEQLHVGVVAPKWSKAVKMANLARADGRTMSCHWGLSG